MTSTLMKLVCRNAVNSFKIRNNLILQHKRFLEIHAKITTMAEVKQSLIDLMGLKPEYQPLPTSREYLLKYLPKTQEELPTRHMQDSFCEAIIPLGSDIVLQEKYVTFLGHIRIGRLMEDMDIFAVWAASKHILNPKQQPGVPTPYVLVTVLVDQINFTDLVPKHNADIRLSGHVCWVGKSSIETVVWMEQMVNGQWVKLTRAIFLMAARNSINSGPALVNPLVASSEYEQNILSGGQDRNKRRKSMANASFLKNLPTETEQQVIHDIFLNTVNVSDPTFSRRHLPPNAGWMRDSVLSSIVFSHPENRNLHNKVFGGFLMRQAFELSWTQAFLYSKVRPKIRTIADIGFFKAVDVGSLLQMHSHVVYTQSNYVMILVHAEIMNPTGHLSTTNNFYYIYEMPEEVKIVLPESYHEAMLYLDGRRRFHHVMGLNESEEVFKDALENPQAPDNSRGKPQ